MGREGRVVTAAVVHVQEQAGVKHAGFCFCVVPVRAEDVQEVLRKGAVRERRDDVKRAVALLMLVGIVPVHRELRETGDEFEALPHDAGQRDIVALLIVGIEGEHAAGERVHDVERRFLHDDVSYESCGQLAVLRKRLGKHLEFFFVW